jgi:hypothetical protein
MALLLVLGYYHVPAITSACERLAAMKQAGGVWFVIAASALAGAILPELAKAAVLGERRVDRARVNAVTFAVFAFAGGGLIVDCQYRLLGWWIGQAVDWQTVAIKLLIDQFLMTPVYGVPYWIVLYDWRNKGYNPLGTLGAIGPGWYVTRVLPLLIPAWAFWLPMVCLIYALPGGLQFSLYSFALAAWSLIMVCVASRHESVHSVPTIAPPPELPAEAQPVPAES